MTHVALGTALACFAMTAVLARLAWRRLGVARQLLLTPASRLDALPVGRCKLTGELQPAGAVVFAPFTGRAVLYVRATLYGQSPGAGPWSKLWEQTFTAPARLTDPRGSVALDLAFTQVLSAREYRDGTVRALVPDTKVLPRILVRAGYETPPPPSQFFHLREDVLLPNERVTVLCEHDGTGTLRGSDTEPITVSNLNTGRIFLRAAWGPVLALLLATITFATGATVVATWWWLR